jgi:hypothetical protein
VSLTALLPELPQVFRSFWGAFGWGHVELPASLYVALGGLVGLALIGWARHLIRPRFENAGAKPNHRSSPATAGIFLLAALWCLAVLVALLRWMQQVGAPHGRLLFPALGAWGLLLAVGWSGLSPSRYSSFVSHSTLLRGLVTRFSSFIPVAGLLALSLAIPFTIIRPAFAPPRFLSPQEADRDVTPRTLNYGGQARLLGYRVQPESVAAGESIKVTLCWEALRPMDQDYSLFIHLLGRDNSRVAERISYPGQGRFPTRLWPPGRAFCDSYQLGVAPWTPTPELYALEVGLFNAESGRRLPAQDESGQPVAPPNVGLVRITPAVPPSEPAHALAYAYSLDGQIELVGYDGPTTLASGNALTLTLHWQALEIPQGDYSVFVHLLDETGELVTQDDTPPRGGRYPTWAWQPGDLVPDLHQLVLPDERLPGPYSFLVGMYRTDSLERLPVTGPDGPLPSRAIPLGKAGDSEVHYP